MFCSRSRQRCTTQSLIESTKAHSHKEFETRAREQRRDALTQAKSDEREDRRDIAAEKRSSDMLAFERERETRLASESQARIEGEREERAARQRKADQDDAAATANREFMLKVVEMMSKK